MIFDAGTVLVVVPMPRVHPGWFFGLFLGVLAFGVLVMLVVTTSCGGEQVATEPGMIGSSGTALGDCEPFCGLRATGSIPTGW